MSDLRLPLAKIGDTGCAIDQTVDVAAIQPESAPPTPVKTLQLKGKLQPLEGDYLFRGRVHGQFSCPCDRCLTERDFSVDLDLTWFFEPGDLDLALQDDETRYFQGDSLDLAPYLWEELVLELPAKFTCEVADGQPVCGVDSAEWVSGDVPDETATQDEGNNAFARLKDLFPDLNAGKEEE